MFRHRDPDPCNFVALLCLAGAVAIFTWLAVDDDRSSRSPAVSSTEELPEHEGHGQARDRSIRSGGTTFTLAN